MSLMAEELQMYSVSINDDVKHKNGRSHYAAIVPALFSSLRLANDSLYLKVMGLCRLRETQSRDKLMSTPYRSCVLREILDLKRWDTMYVTKIQMIVKGEEIFVDYGSSYDLEGRIDFESSEVLISSNFVFVVYFCMDRCVERNATAR